MEDRHLVEALLTERGKDDASFMNSPGLLAVGRLLASALDARTEVVGGRSLVLAMAVAVIAGRDAFYVREECKGHGTRRLVEGPVKPGQVCSVLEFEAGPKTLEVCRRIEDFGLKIVEVVALLGNDSGLSYPLKVVLT